MSENVSKANTNGNVHEKIKLREKICYTMITMGPAPLLNLMTSFLMIFYTNVVGLNPAAVATLFLVSRVMDAVTDPVTGFVLDHLPRTRMGKFRHLLIIGSVVCCANFMLVWFGPALATSGKLVIAYISYLLIGVTYDVMDVSKNSMLAVLTPDAQQRNSLTQFSSVGSLVGVTLVGIVAPLIIGDGYSATFEDYRMLIVICVIFVISFCTLGSLGVKERVKPAEDDHEYTIKEFFKILTARPVLALTVFSLLISLGNYINSGFDAYYFTYVIHDLTILSKISMLSMVVMIIGIIFAKPIAKRIGDKNTVLLAYVVMIAAFIIRLVAPTSVACVYIGTLLVRFCTGLYLPALGPITAGNVDYIAETLNTRSEGALSAVSSFVSKLGSSVGGALPGYILAFSGFVSDALVQPEAVTDSIIFASLGGPIIFFALAIIVLKFWYISPEQLGKKQ